MAENIGKMHDNRRSIRRIEASLKHSTFPVDHTALPSHHPQPTQTNLACIFVVFYMWYIVFLTKNIIGFSVDYLDNRCFSAAGISVFLQPYTTNIQRCTTPEPPCPF